MNEFSYIDWLRRQTPLDPRVEVGPGDDCAVLKAPSGGRWLVTTDMLMDGVDFCLEEVDVWRVGRKAMAVNLSDIAAMAGRPVAATISVALPRRDTQKLAEELYRGLRDLADEFQTTIIGGDTNTWDGPLVISVTLLGEVVGDRPILRSGAKPGDWIFVTGPLGGSILGKHFDFTPRVREALTLRERADLHALIDISDGLAADANHIAEESGCGIVLNAARIPIAEAARQMDDGKSPLEHALSDGEDFELAFAISPEDGRKLLRDQPVPGIQLAHFGEFVAERGLWIEEESERRNLAPRGYVHRFG